MSDNSTYHKYYTSCFIETVLAGKWSQIKAECCGGRFVQACSSKRDKIKGLDNGFWCTSKSAIVKLVPMVTVIESLELMLKDICFEVELPLFGLLQVGFTKRCYPSWSCCHKLLRFLLDLFLLLRRRCFSCNLVWKPHSLKGCAWHWTNNETCYESFRFLLWFMLSVFHFSHWIHGYCLEQKSIKPLNSDLQTLTE